MLLAKFSRPLLLTPLLLSALALLGCREQDGTPEPANPRLAVLLSDFGEADYRTPSMKGLMYSAFPGIRLVDGTHSLPAFDVATGAFVLEVTARSFPDDAIFVAAVAPGSVQRFLVLRAGNGQDFVLPDNGLGTYVARTLGVAAVHAVTSQAFFSGPVASLPVREVLGVTGALLASGTPIEDFGPRVTDMAMLDVQEAAVQGDKVLGAVVYVDGFGNSITNIPADLVSGFPMGERVHVTLPSGNVETTMGTGYGDVPRGDTVAHVNSLGLLELSINFGNFAAAYGLEAGSPVEASAG